MNDSPFVIHEIRPRQPRVPMWFRVAVRFATVWLVFFLVFRWMKWSVPTVDATACAIGWCLETPIYRAFQRRMRKAR